MTVQIKPMPMVFVKSELVFAVVIRTNKTIELSRIIEMGISSLEPRRRYVIIFRTKEVEKNVILTTDG